MVQYTIAMLTCWYGTFPWYFPYFIHSCTYNTSIDFYILTDNEQIVTDKPDNVKIIYKTLTGINETTTDKLGFTVNIEHPYKLCDFKPAYGFLFDDILNDYDFWGHCDIDVVYGNIRVFITDELMQRFDIISPRHDWVPVFFLLFKNTEKMNTLLSKARITERYSKQSAFLF